jgi:DNA-binding NarL/FixJ family response regulator
VLIADDSARARDGLRALFATWPELAVVGEAANGQEAVRLVAEQRPDIVLMDVHMPVLDGLQATRAIKQQWPGVAVVLLTMYTLEHSQALDAGAEALVLKGGPPDRLLAALGIDVGVQ